METHIRSPAHSRRLGRTFTYGHNHDRPYETYCEERTVIFIYGNNHHRPYENYCEEKTVTCIQCICPFDPLCKCAFMRITTHTRCPRRDG